MHSPTHDICSQASPAGAMPEVPRVMTSLTLGVTWALTPACPLQVFGTSPEQHAEAIERVKKAKVRLPPACTELTSHSAHVQGLGWGHRRGPCYVHTKILEAPQHLSARRPPHML